MFSTMRDRVSTTSSMEPITLENLARFETDSIDSLPRSDVVSTADSIASKTYSIGSGVSFFDKIGLRRNSSMSFSETSSRFPARPKDDVVSILRSIKEMNNVPSAKMSLIPFFEMIQSHYYRDVSLSLLETFISQHNMLPKPIYFHYYIYFLHYAEYYHQTRCTTGVIDKNKIIFHQEKLAVVRSQLKYVYRIVNRKKQEPKPSPTEISL